MGVRVLVVVVGEGCSVEVVVVVDCVYVGVGVSGGEVVGRGTSIQVRLGAKFSKFSPSSWSKGEKKYFMLTM